MASFPSRGGGGSGLTEVKGHHLPHWDASMNTACHEGLHVPKQRIWPQRWGSASEKVTPMSCSGREEKGLYQRLSCVFRAVVCFVLGLCLSPLGHTIPSPGEAAAWRHRVALCWCRWTNKPAGCGAAVWPSPAPGRDLVHCILSSTTPWGQGLRGSMVPCKRKTGNGTDGRNSFHLVLHVLRYTGAKAQCITAAGGRDVSSPSFDTWDSMWDSVPQALLSPQYVSSSTGLRDPSGSSSIQWDALCYLCLNICKWPQHAVTPGFALQGYTKDLLHDPSCRQAPKVPTATRLLHREVPGLDFWFLALNCQLWMCQLQLPASCIWTVVSMHEVTHWS